ncbi:Ribosomal RNA large subunit methyltransferase J [Zhongshania aliphaticivorans]|uniref:Ribosomal RNA large subunit methyltransferase J n=1 Tax=Zhongshania aliphaticivorans TaxID=1470434 RepID=A0A5S9PNB1_9GAMM|nr:23S rRNA (adenine(2030)-N(6))-methyltransferase RlmJ [Zhongshania aliphaticivorans]CAA0105788.1 Ribosomal RNA large subunit methyltransferase J [Zhongshania aliphaticivorans]CAA0105986.1 Ribosomal RNA large subunit methyltransferase J [Zhongshania aliphaticivorans]
MLSYRHGFHAGNHADVLKHVVEVLILDYLMQKPTALSYIDTHAGAGFYHFASTFSAQNREFDSGITKLRNADGQFAPPLARYLDIVESCSTNEAAGYPGSPAIAIAMLRKQDKAHLFELHPNDHQNLSKRFKHQAQIKESDGFAGLKSVLPPPSKRGLILIDPPYEDKNDYRNVIASLKDSQRRFPNGVYALWYPLIPRDESKDLGRRLKALSPNNYLHAQLHVQAEQGSHGMYGSAMFVINPPWQLHEQMQEVMPVLQTLLADGENTPFKLDAVIA